MTNTVHQLRKEGNKVRVEHYRRYFDTVNKCYVFLTNYQYSLLNKSLIKGPLATGGYTVITLTTCNGNEFSGDARCSTKENYCKRTGVATALERLLNLMITPSQYTDCSTTLTYHIS